MVRIYHKGCLCCWREDRCLLFTRRLSEGCTADYVQQVVDALLERGFFSKAQYEKMEFLLRKVYRTITLRRYNNGSV
ncbi:MAG: Lin1244/Lin1753 domain-containing protein [Phocaeicola vulgatus]